MNIKITPEYLEKINNSGSLQTLLKKSLGNRASYQLARIFNKLEQEIRIYLAEKQKIVERYAKRYESDGEQKDKNGKVIKSWKKGDIIFDGQTVKIADPQEFNIAMMELLQTEIDLGIEKVKIDYNDKKVDDLSIEEMRILLPLITEAK